MSDDNKTLTVTITRTATAEGGYTYGFAGEGKGSVDASSGQIDFAGKDKDKYAITFVIGSPFDSTIEDVGFDDPPVTFTVPSGLFSQISVDPGNQQASVTDDNSKDEVQGYEYTLFFSDTTQLDPRIINRN